MQFNYVETAVGGLVIIIAASFFAFGYKNYNHGNVEYNKYYAEFDRADGLNVGSDVRMSGVIIGQVVSLSLQKATYLAKVAINIDKKIVIPADSSAAIVSNGLLGSKYLVIVPGGDAKTLLPEDTITYTQSSINLESLIGKFIFSNNQ